MAEAESSFADLEGLIELYQAIKKDVSENESKVNEIKSKIDEMYESIIPRVESLRKAEEVLERERILREPHYNIDLDADDVFSKIKAILKFETNLLLDRAKEIYKDIPIYSPNGKNPTFETFKPKLKLYLEHFGLEIPKELNYEFVQALEMSQIASEYYFRMIKEVIQKHFEIEKEKGVDLFNIWDWYNTIVEYEQNVSLLKDIENKITKNPKAILEYIIALKQKEQLREEENDIEIVFENAVKFGKNLTNEYHATINYLFVSSSAVAMMTDNRRRQIENINTEQKVSFSYIKSDVNYGELIENALDANMFGVALYLVKHGVKKETALKLFTKKYGESLGSSFEKFYDFVEENADKFEILKE